MDGAGPVQAATENTAIKTYDYGLTTTGHGLKTTLRAYSRAGSALRYEITESPKYGRAEISGDQLYYTPRGDGDYTDVFTVTAFDQNQNSAGFKIEVTGRKK